MIFLLFKEGICFTVAILLETQNTIIKAVSCVEDSWMIVLQVGTLGGNLCKGERLYVKIFEVLFEEGTKIYTSF